MRNVFARRDVLKTAATGPAMWHLFTQTTAEAAAVSGNDWPQFQYDAANTGYNPDAEGPTGELTERWSFSTLGEVVSSPIVVDDTVYVGSKDGKVYALNAETGEKEWEYDTGADIHSSPVSDGTTIYIGNQDGTVFAISLDGVEEWTTSFDGAVSGGLSVVDGRLFVPVDGINQIVALDASSGLEGWRNDAKGAKVAVANGVVYVNNYHSDGYGVSSGELVWDPSDYATEDDPLTYNSNTIYKSDSEIIAALNSQDESTRWEYELSSDANYWTTTPSVAVRKRTLYAIASVTSSAYLIAVDTVTGQRQWRVELPNEVYSAPILTDSLIYVGCDDGNIYSFNRSDGSKISSFKTDAAVQSTAAISAGAIFVGSNDGYVYAIEDLPPNEEPTASFSYSPSPVITDREAEFDATESNDPDGSIASYSWDFDGNGATDARGDTVTTTFDSSGEQDVTLTVTDDRGASVSTSKTVSVNEAPEPAFSYSPTIPNVDESVTFDADESTDSDGSIDRLEWDFDDDGEIEATGMQVTHAFSQPGDYRVSLSVTDDDGTSRTVSQTVSVNDGPIAAFSFSPEQPGIGQTVTFDAAESSDPDGSIESYEWYIQGTDSVDATGETATTTYDVVGEYTISLMVTDSNGATDTIEKTLNVVEAPDTSTPTPTTSEPPVTDPDGSTDGDEQPASGDPPTTELATEPSGSEQKGSESPLPSLDSVPVVGAIAGGATVLGGGALLARRRSGDGNDESAMQASAGDEGSALTETLPDPDGELSASFADFEKLDLIGKGGSGDVHRARITVDGVDRMVALKTPRVHNYQTIDEGFAKEFLSEAETWSGLDDHEHIVDVLDWGHTPQPWIAMEYMDDGSLQEHLPLEIDRGIEVLTAVADATQHAHRHGVAHGDLKPENVLFSTKDGKSVVKVGDWGLAKVLLDHSESTQGLSPAYAAPEQFEESIRDAKGFQLTDVYQLGALAYAAFTGQPPYEGSPAVIMNKVLNERPTPPSEVNPDLPETVNEFVFRAMARSPDDRYPTARHFRDALEETLKSM